MDLVWENTIIFRKYLVTIRDSGFYLYLVGMYVSFFHYKYFICVIKSYIYTKWEPIAQYIITELL